MTISEFHNRLVRIDVWEILTPILTKHMYLFIEANKQQLIDGVTKTGEMIRPKYTEDPYFKTRDQALAYARWKNKKEKAGEIPSSTSKYYTAPNLYINGYFHSQIVGAVTDLGIEIGSKGFGSDFDKKYKNIFGVTPENLQKILIGEILSEFIVELKKAMGIA